ncbi:hypothetical protein [Telluribacter sp.]|jgi:hypothetical protein|uniref:hypothetical protein n=1 Tax=Telluribacter sp. TaxID=1978767 RepID=UPI002E15F488|nr:hypothetical protein [Telluribacter sp.]
MKKLLLLLLVVSFLGCKESAPAPDPDFAANFVGEYWTITTDGNSSTNQTWVVTSRDKRLNITYTINYLFKSQGKEIRSTDVYTLKDVLVLNPTAFKIDQQADLNEDGKVKVRRVEGEAIKSTKPDGSEVIGITFKFTDQGSTTSVTTDYLEFKKK